MRWSSGDDVEQNSQTVEHKRLKHLLKNEKFRMLRLKNRSSSFSAHREIVFKLFEETSRRHFVANKVPIR